MENRVLAALPAQDLKRLLPHLTPVSLQNKQVLYEAGGAISEVYFPRSGVVSWLAFMQSGASFEVATIGSEGVVGFRALLGDDKTSARAVVQVPGEALRIKSSILRGENRRAGLRDVVHRYLNALLTQVSLSVACNSLHPLEKRFCRWLLATQDRVHADQFPLTHELMAQMLLVRRAGVTEAASKLQKAGLIRYVHGKITILDRRGLEAASCECYHAVKAEYDRLIG
jgi:CRP-like cAMP-binding protein